MTPEMISTILFFFFISYQSGSPVRRVYQGGVLGVSSATAFFLEFSRLALGTLDAAQ